MVALDAAIVAREHWGRLEAQDRRELGRLVKKSQGRPGNLSERERSEKRSGSLGAVLRRCWLGRTAAPNCAPRIRSTLPNYFQ